MLKRYFILMAMLTQLYLPAHAGEDTGWTDRHTGWYVCGYLGQLTDTDFWEVLTFQVDPVPSYMATLAIGKEVWRYKKYLDVEIEAQIAKYFNDYVFDCYTPSCRAAFPDDPPSARQDHWEFNALFAVRWLKFPWDRYIDTSFAVGEGFSYATSVPAVERDLHGEVVGLDNKTSKLLNYLMVEAAFGLPSYPKWNLIFRVHHRSGVFGLFNDVHGGSNTIGIGLRYKL
jgi:hypothetical protein